MYTVQPHVKPTSPSAILHVLSASYSHYIMPPASSSNAPWQRVKLGAADCGLSSAWDAAGADANYLTSIKDEGIVTMQDFKASHENDAKLAEPGVELLKALHQKRLCNCWGHLVTDQWAQARATDALRWEEQL